MSHVAPGGWSRAGAGGSSLGGDLVTGEAVVLDLRLAKVPSRAVGILVDIVIQLLLFWLLTYVVGQLVLGGDSATSAALTLGIVVAVIIGYPVLWETLTRGRSPGKYVMGLRVVRDDGGAASFRHALARALVGVIEIWLTLGSIAFLTSLVSSKGKRAGDYAAGTVVLRERVPDLTGAPTQMPPALAGWAYAADLSRLPDGLALSARQFLARAPQLSPGPRWEMGRRLADETTRFVTPLPPPGCPPEAYLAAVVAERRRREVVRQQASAPRPVAPQGGPWPAPAAQPPAPPPTYPPPPQPSPAPPAVEPGGFVAPG
jgi:uncharacterized RDD family membrane protein YckC